MEPFIRHKLDLISFRDELTKRLRETILTFEEVQSCDPELVARCEKTVSAVYEMFRRNVFIIKNSTNGSRYVFGTEDTKQELIAISNEAEFTVIDLPVEYPKTLSEVCYFIGAMDFADDMFVSFKTEILRKRRPKEHEAIDRRFQTIAGKLVTVGHLENRIRLAEERKQALEEERVELMAEIATDKAVLYRDIKEMNTNKEKRFVYVCLNKTLSVIHRPCITH